MIDVVPIRNEFRDIILDAAIIDDSLYAWEGRYFSPDDTDEFISEIVTVERDKKTACFVDGTTVVFTYVVYTRAGDSNGNTFTERNYEIMQEIEVLFKTARPFLVGDVSVTITDIRRRPSTIGQAGGTVVTNAEKVWRVSPVDIVVKLEQPISKGD